MGAARQRYMALWREADALFRRLDPCAFRDGVCAAGLEDGCCLCDHHPPGEPCPYISLGCKLHVCEVVKERYPDLVRSLEAIQHQAAALALPLEVFSTVDDCG
jgi:hypothetical protein